MLYVLHIRPTFLFYYFLNLKCSMPESIERFKEDQAFSSSFDFAPFPSPAPPVNKQSFKGKTTFSNYFRRVLYFRQSPAIFTKLNYEEQLHFGGFFPKPPGLFLDFLYHIVSGTRSAPFCVIQVNTTGKERIGEDHPVRCR
jgi:hypothetical protein